MVTLKLQEKTFAIDSRGGLLYQGKLVKRVDPKEIPDHCAEGKLNFKLVDF